VIDRDARARRLGQDSLRRRCSVAARAKPRPQPPCVGNELQHVGVAHQQRQAGSDPRALDFENRRPDAAAQERLRGAFDDDAAGVHQREPIAEQRLVHVVSRDEHAYAALREIVNEFPELAARQRIEAGGWLVEEQHVGLVEQCRGNGESALVPERDFPRAQRGLIGKIEPFERPLDTHASPPLVETVETCLKREVLPHGKVGVQRESLGNVADAPLRFARAPDHVHARDVNRPAAGSQRSAQHANRRCLAGPVGAE
jgi:hypothetical protein